MGGVGYGLCSIPLSEVGAAEGCSVSVALSKAICCCSVKTLAFLGRLVLLGFVMTLPEWTRSSFLADRVLLDIGLVELDKGIFVYSFRGMSLGCESGRDEGSRSVRSSVSDMTVSSGSF